MCDPSAPLWFMILFTAVATGLVVAVTSMVLWMLHTLVKYLTS